MYKIFFLLIIFLGLSHSQSVAEFYTSMGNFKCKLREDLVPLTVGKFVDRVHEKYHDKTRFNRVVAGFVIQAGINDGTIAQFKDEFNPLLKHYKAGILSMGNTGPNTNDVEFFLTLASQSFLDNHYSVFGEVIENISVVLAIGRVPTDAKEEPLTKVSLDSIRIISGMVSTRKNISQPFRYNPFSRSLEMDPQNEITGIDYLDMHGKRVYAFPVLKDSKSFPTPQEPGLYFARVKGREKGSQIFKILVP